MNIIPQELLYKLPAILADIATAFLIYKILLPKINKNKAFIGASIYLFNPAVFANSTLWGQVDSFVAFFLMLSIYLIPDKYILSAIALSVGTLFKPQVAFIFPVILHMFYENPKLKLKHLLFYCLIGLFIFAAAYIPFWTHGNLISFIIERLSVSANQYPYTSVNAFNFWGLGGFWKPDTYQFFVGVTLTLIVSLFSLRLNKSPYFFASVILVSSFIFMTRMHERHFLPALAPLAVIVMENPKFLIAYIGFSLTYVANLYYAYVWITKDFKEVFSVSLLKLFSIINLIFLSLVLFPQSLNVKLKLNTSQIKTKAFAFPKTNFIGVNFKYVLYGILIFAAITRFYNLGSPPEEYFDEVYHAYTAKVMLSSENFKAWEWWNTPPEGFAYEWTHPPLAKIGMAAGMLIFGENAFGYRFFGAVLGLGIVYLVYLLAKQVFKDEFLALLAAFVYSLDGLALVMSRIAMNDSYILFFSLLSIYLFIKNKNLGSAMAFGLAISSKWSAIWMLPILFVLWLKRKNKFEPSVFAMFILIPPAIYLLSYFQMFTTGHAFDIWWGMQKQMWWYHTSLVAEHPYTSQWWSWPLLIRPIYLYTSNEINNMVARIYAFGNPFVFWAGVASIFYSIIYVIREKNRDLALIVFSYLIFFVPWAASPRIMFLYHYLPSVPFMAIAIGYVLRRNPKIIYSVLALFLMSFIYYYPHWAGLQIPLPLDQSYYWFDSWR